MGDCGESWGSLETRGNFGGHEKAKVSYDNQSAYKTRESAEGLQPGDVQTDTPRGSILPDDDDDA